MVSILTRFGSLHEYSVKLTHLCQKNFHVYLCLKQSFLTQKLLLKDMYKIRILLSISSSPQDPTGMRPSDKISVSHVIADLEEETIAQNFLSRITSFFCDMKHTCDTSYRGTGYQLFFFGPSSHRRHSTSCHMANLSQPTLRIQEGRKTTVKLL